jgi:hypothetical protein
MTAFRDIVPCSLLEVYRRLRRVYCLQHGDEYRPDDADSKHL